MLVTSQNMFDAVLDGINKEQTGTVTPSEFEALINDAQFEIVRDRIDEGELIQKRIDDIRILKCVDSILNTGPTVAGEEVFNLPYSPTTFVTTPGNPSGDNYGYLSMLNCAANIYYVNNICGLKGESKLLKCKVMKTNNEFELARNPYGKPKDTRLYYEVIQNRIRLLTGTDSYGLKCRISYYRYPRLITLGNPNSCELPLHLRYEIVDVAVRKKLQRIQSESYQAKIIDNNLSFR